MKNQCKCKMTVRDRKTGKTSVVITNGEYWDLMADEYEKRNADKKVIKLEGV